MLKNSNGVLFTFGRFNPPTKGHQYLFENLSAVAKKTGSDFYIFPSPKELNSLNPLSFEEKCNFLVKMFPEYKENFIFNRSIISPMHAIEYLDRKEYRLIGLQVGADRYEKFKTFEEYGNGNLFSAQIVITSIKRMDLNGLNISGSECRKLAGSERIGLRRGAFEEFLRFMPYGTSEKMSLELYTKLKHFYGQE